MLIEYAYDEQSVWNKKQTRKASLFRVVSSLHTNFDYSAMATFATQRQLSVALSGYTNATTAQK